MKCLVCISNVPDTTTKIKFDASGKELDKAGVSFVINPYDEYGLVRSIEFKEQTGSGSTTVICVGKAEVEQTIRKALAIGADDAARVDADPTDAYFIAKQIAEYARGKGFDFIFFGKESIDSNGAQIAGMVAEMLGVAYAPFASKLDVSGGKAVLEREAEGGTEVVELAMPVVVSCQKGISEWRIPNMKGIMAARTKKIEVVQPVAVSAYTSGVKYELPPAKAGCVMIAPENVSDLVQVLVQKGAL